MKILLAILIGVLAAAILVWGNILRVDEVLSGDLVRIGDTFIARLTGIRAPRPNEPLGPEVLAFAKREIEGRMVKVFTWTTDNTAAGIVYDDEGYPRVRIVYGRNFDASLNEVLLKKGYARIDPKYLPDELSPYLDLEKEARSKGLGIWK